MSRASAPTKRTSNTVSVALEGVRAPRWGEGFRRFCLGALRSMGAQGWDLSVLLCDDPTMRALNARYRGIRRTTDVLSFSQREGAGVPGGTAAATRTAGDLVISLDTLRRNAARFGVPEGEELRRLAVHGLLHLAGMDHGAGHGDAMLRRQEQLLAALGRRMPGGMGRKRG